MISKHEGAVWEVLSYDKIKSTNEVKQEVELKSKKVINWHLIYKILRDLTESGKVEMLKNRSGLFWRKK